MKYYKEKNNSSDNEEDINFDMDYYDKKDRAQRRREINMSKKRNKKTYEYNDKWF